MNIEENAEVSSFIEKPRGDGAWINGGFFVCEPEVCNMITGDETVFEEQPLNKIAELGELVAYKHDGFWQCMDSLRDKTNLLNMWNNNAVWKKW